MESRHIVFRTGLRLVTNSSPDWLKLWSRMRLIPDANVSSQRVASECLKCRCSLKLNQRRCLDESCCLLCSPVCRHPGGGAGQDLQIRRGNSLLLLPLVHGETPFALAGRRLLLLILIPRRWHKRPLTTGAPSPVFDPPVAFWLEVQLFKGEKDDKTVAVLSNLLWFQVKAASKYVDVPVSATATPHCLCVSNRLSWTFDLPDHNHPAPSPSLPLPVCGCAHLMAPLFSPLCSAPQKPGMDVADGYVTFVRHSQDMLRDKVNEEVYIERLFDVSKMPSPPPHSRGGAIHNVAKQPGREG